MLILFSMLDWSHQTLTHHHSRYSHQRKGYHLHSTHHLCYKYQYNSERCANNVVTCCKDSVVNTDCSDTIPMTWKFSYKCPFVIKQDLCWGKVITIIVTTRHQVDLQQVYNIEHVQIHKKKCTRNVLEKIVTWFSNGFW